MSWGCIGDESERGRVHPVYSVNFLDESKRDSNQEVGQVKDIMRLAGYARGLDQDIPTHLLQSRIVRTEKIQKG